MKSCELTGFGDKLDESRGGFVYPSRTKYRISIPLFAAAPVSPGFALPDDTAAVKLQFMSRSSNATVMRSMS